MTDLLINLRLPKDAVKFRLGRVCLTPGAQAGFAAGDDNGETGANEITEMLRRHSFGDWGEMCPEDRAANDDAVKHGMRIMSAYTYRDVKYWVITEWDRSVTTILLPEEY